MLLLYCHREISTVDFRKLIGSMEETTNSAQSGFATVTTKTFSSAVILDEERKCTSNVKPKQKKKHQEKKKSIGDNTSSKKEIYRRHGLKPVDYWHPCIYPECPERFNFTKDLYDHIRSHSDECESKVEKCPYCNVEMAGITSLVRHVRIHTKHEPYICPFQNCGQSYAHKCTLSDHLQSQVHQLSDFIYDNHHFIC